MGMGMQPTAANLGDVRLPLTFILSGLSLFVLAQGLLLGGVSGLIQGTVQVPYLLSVAHLLVLGFATMIAMGVMYQLAPVALQTKIYFPRLAAVQYGFYLIGVLGIWWSFYHFSALHLLIFASLAIIGILLFEFNLWISILKASHSEIRTAVGSALANLLITIGLGFWLALNIYNHSDTGELQDRLLAVHILFGTVGWFTLLIIGFSFKLIPMFTLSHGYDIRFGKSAIYAIDTGLIAAGIGLFGKLAVFDYLGGVLIVAGFICYGIQLKIILDRRMRKRFDPGVAAALYAMPLTLLFLVIIGLTSLLTGRAFEWRAVVYLVIIGWISLTILSYLYKIIPFLWWTHKYGKVIGSRKVPNLKDMMHEKRGIVWLVLMFAAVCANAVAVCLQSMPIGYIGQTVFFIVSLIYASELAMVLKK